MLKGMLILGEKEVSLTASRRERIIESILEDSYHFQVQHVFQESLELVVLLALGAPFASFFSVSSSSVWHP